MTSGDMIHRDENNRPAPRITGALLLVMLALCFASCGRQQDGPPGVDADFCEYTKEGSLALFIVGDYFSHHFMSELVQLSKVISTGGEPVFVCTRQYHDVLSRLLPAN